MSRRADAASKRTGRDLKARAEGGRRKVGDNLRCRERVEEGYRAELGQGLGADEREDAHGVLAARSHKHDISRVLASPVSGDRAHSPSRPPLASRPAVTTYVRPRKRVCCRSRLRDVRPQHPVLIALQMKYHGGVRETDRRRCEPRETCQARLAFVLRTAKPLFG